MKISKRLVLSALCMILIMSLFISAMGEEMNTWDCQKCGRIGNTGNYCGGCNQHAPWIEDSDEPAVTTEQSNDYNSIYEDALQNASMDLSNLDNLREAVSALEKAGTYAYSKSYLVYLQQILSIQSADADFNDIVLKLEICQKIEPFESDLAARGFPSCGDLIAYAMARELENEGKLAQAKSAYESLIILDALDRAIALAKITQNMTYTITWKDDAGETIDITTVGYGDMPTHANPDKARDNQYTYSFYGWEPEVREATEDAVYKAIFSKETRFYKITWKDDKGKTIDTTTVEYGKKPTHAKPTKASDKNYTYSFAGWEPEITKVTGKATYKAKFRKKAKPVTVPVLSEVYPGIVARMGTIGDTYYLYSYLGPGKTFVGSGSYQSDKLKEIIVYFEEDGYVLADVQYQTVDERYVWLPAGHFGYTKGIPSVSKLKYYTGTTTADIKPNWGPAGKYRQYNNLAINKGTEIKIFFQENGFVYAEYSSGKGKARMWLPANKIKINDASVTLGNTGK